LDFIPFHPDDLRLICWSIDAAAMPPMRFTLCGPRSGCTMDTLQFFYVKVASIDDSLQWPLDVYGFVAVRDVLDRKRNMIFCCDRDNCQTINQQVLTHSHLLSINVMKFLLLDYVNSYQVMTKYTYNAVNAHVC
jgi:hypothetical protein